MPYQDSQSPFCARLGRLYKSALLFTAVLGGLSLGAASMRADELRQAPVQPYPARLRRSLTGAAVS